MEDDSPVEAVSTPNTPRNLAAWKISIPYVDFFEDDHGHCIFIILTQIFFHTNLYNLFQNKQTPTYIIKTLPSELGSCFTTII